MCVLIKSPLNYIYERKYIYNLIFRYFFGLEFKVTYEDRDDIEIYISGSDEKLFLADILFKTTQNNWLMPSSLPKQPLAKWTIDKKIKSNIAIVNNEVPIIYGTETEAENYLLTKEDSIHLGLDIFGSAFFMLTRYEEYIKPERDQHDRFPATASLAYQEAFLDRPIINEYLEIIWYCMKRLWPGLERKKRRFCMLVSHDVDVPFAQAFTGISKLIHNCGGDVLKRKSPILALQRVKSWQAVRNGDYRKDIYYTFDQIMNISEQNSLQSAFYFKTACTDPNYDDNYCIEHPWIRQLIRDIYNRGHEIGIHPSYKTYQDSKQVKLEFKRLLKVCEEEGIKQNEWGGRQHYLRWIVPITWRDWNEAGIDYDSTLTYADHAGFRCGICYEYPVYDLKHRKQLKLIERPLVVMEGSIFGEEYMNLSSREAFDYIHKLKDYCGQFNGDFTLLWHNSSFDISDIWSVYEEILTNN